MTLPTLYFLTVEDCGDEWAIFEQHMCQEKGCFKTDKELVGWFETKAEALHCCADYENKHLLDGIVVSIEVEV